MKKLNMYDIVPVTPPKVRLEELLTAEEVLKSDFEEAKKNLKSNEVIYEGVKKILDQRQSVLKFFKNELIEEIGVEQGGLITYGEIVHFRDQEVERAVREELRVFDRSITRIDMSSIKKLFIEGCYSIEGLQYASNIEELILTWTDIFTDIESDRDTAIIFSIIRPTLKKLAISHSVINKYTALSVLYNLESITIISNYSGYFDFAIFGLLMKVESLTISERCISPKIKEFLNKNPHCKEGITIV